MRGSHMARGGGGGRRELLDRWRAIQEEQDEDDPSPSKQREILRAKEQWFSDTFDFLINLPRENHIWCGCSDLMGPLLETFHNYFDDKHDNTWLKLIWKKISQELGQCTQCICQHHQAQETYNTEYESDTVDPLLKVLHCLDEERITGHLKEINARIRHKEYDPDCHSVEVVSLMFEVLMFPMLLDDQSLVNEFQTFIEAIDHSHEVTLAGNQQYPGIYALLFLKNGRARAIALRLAGNMGKLRRASDLEPLQPLLRKYIGILETEVLPATFDASRPRVQLERITVWLGIKTLLGFLEAPAFEEGILEKYPVFLSIVLNHVSDDTSEFSYAVTCLKASYEMLGCKLWLRTTLSPSMMRNTLLGQCFHTRNEKSHKEIFELFIPFLQSLEALQDGEHEKQRRHFLYFLLHQVPHSSNFSFLMKKNARKISLLIIHRGYTMNPPSPPFECAHMWGPSLVCSLKDTSLHSSLRQPAFDLIQTIIVSDTSALMSLFLKYRATSNIGVSTSADFIDNDDELPFSYDVEESDNGCWSEFSIQNKLTSRECKAWTCVPMLWFDALVEADPSMLPISFSKSVFWALSHISMVEPHSSMHLSASVRDWLSSCAGEISSSFGWEVPNGSDDGGDGIESRNSVKASSMCIPLAKTFKRFAAHFILQLKQHGLQKQWTWEPRMSESLILLLIDPNDSIRQAGRGILEHVSKTKGLTSGLQFLCSSAYSLSAIFLGFRYASKQVQLGSFLDNFQNLHHLFFVMHKLLKEVVTSPNKSSSNHMENPKGAKFLSEGGFLRQPSFDHLPIGSSGFSPIVVDIKSWEKFSYLLSEIMWPSMLKCVVEGKKLIDSKICQMTCIRLLETIAVVFERLSSSSSKLSGTSESLVPAVFDFRWLCDLVDWGKSSLDVIIRYWKQCMLSLLSFFKGLQSCTSPSTLSDIEAIVSHDKVEVDQLKEKVFHLKISLSCEESCTEGKIAKSTPLPSEPSFGQKSSSPLFCIYEGKGVHGRNTERMQKIRVEEVVVLSDDETENLVPPESVVLSFNKSPRHLSKEALSPAAKRFLSDDHLESVSSGLSRSIFRPFPSRASVEDPQVSSQRKEDDALGDNIVSTGVESTVSRITSSLINLKGAGTGKGLSSSSNASEIVRSLKGANSAHKGSLGQPVCCQSSSALPLRTSRTDLELGEEDAIIKEVIHDETDDPLEHALDHSNHPHSVLASVSVPKRKVIQLQMPMNIKSGNKIDSGVRRLKPPRLDEWYRSILQIDYFVIVGLSSANEDAKTTSCSLKEVPLCFESLDHYVRIFRPLVLEEFKAQLYNSYIETSSDDMSRGSLCIISVEKIDDFHIVQGRPDEAESVASRGCLENDLVLLTKEPLKNSSQQVHVLGKVERREKSIKSRSAILVIRFYLPIGSSRLNTIMRLLTERSKWFLSRIMNMTPQFREFQALSSLQDIPMLPIILNPVDCSLKNTESTKIELNKLSQAMQKMLKSSFNNSQLQAISVAIGTQALRRSFQLSLIQGPPGTGKTKTIVALLSALLACAPVHKNASNLRSNSSGSIGTRCTNPRAQVSLSASITRAWQDADFAKQMIKNAEKASSEPTERSAKGRVLMCAQSNAAVDELVSRISKGLYGIDGDVYTPFIVRVGNAKTVHPNSMPFFIDTLVEQRIAEDTTNQNNANNDMVMESSSSLRARLENIVDSIRYYESKRAKLKDSDMNTNASLDDGNSKEDNVQDISDAAIGAKLNILYGQKKEICRDLAASQTRERKDSEENRFLKHKIRKSILREAEIVVTTLSGSGGDLYGVCSESASSNRFGIFSEQTLFDVVVIDEAAQALEPATLIPLQLLKSHGSKCIMVGDPKQLPATVLSNVASKFLYECSMFERLQRAGHPVTMLTEQYRMHPEICRFPSLHFYENKLLNGSEMDSKSAPFHENSCLGPYIFYDVVDGREHHGKHSGSLSLYNESEVQAAVVILKFLKKRYPSEFASRRIGIITPYRSQLSLIRQQFSKAFGPNVISDMEFNTVDGFQGREVDILVLSTVRASDSSAKTPMASSGGIGFVADVRRMNVALTRAKFSLWIFGNARTLQTNLHWAALIHNAKERNLFISSARPYQSNFEKVLSLSRESISSAMVVLHSSHPKRGERVKDARHEAQHIRKNVKEGHGGKIKRIGRELDTNKSSPKGTKNSAEGDHQIGDSEPTRCSTVESTKMKKIVPSCEEKGTKFQNQKAKLVNADDAIQKNPMCDRGGDKAIHADVLLGTDSSMKPLINKKKGKRGYSQQANFCNSNQRSSSPLLSSADGSQNVSNIKNSKSSIQEGAPRDMIASRKRQRDAVDALLSSALISSKKPETSSKPAPVKRPPPTATASCIKKPSR